MVVLAALLSLLTQVAQSAVRWFLTAAVGQRPGPGAQSHQQLEGEP